METITMTTCDRAKQRIPALRGFTITMLLMLGKTCGFKF